MAYFPSTKWSQLVTVAASAGETALDTSQAAKADQALNELCSLYWYPLYAYARGSGCRHEDAEDLTQYFFEYLVSQGLVGRADRSMTKFRTFLLTHFQYVMSNQWRRGQAAKRGGKVEHVSLDLEGAQERYEAQLAEGKAPELLYDEAWANNVVDQALQLLEQEQSRGNPEVPFEALKGFLPGGAAHDRPTYAELTARYPGATEQALMTRVSRLRKRFRELLSSVVADTVSGPAEVEAELKHLVAVLAA